MYPLFWTIQSRKEGYFMRYSYEFKKKCVELYYRGEYPDTPDGIGLKRFHGTIREWVRIEKACGITALKNDNTIKAWTPEERYALVSRVLAGESIRSVAFSVGINNGQLYRWVRKYKVYGYNGLISKQNSSKQRELDMKKFGTRKPIKPNETEHEELLRLRSENECMRAEIEIIKKEIALREEKEAARLKAKKQQSSKNSEKKDTH